MPIFTKEQLDLLYKMIGKFEVPSSPCTFAQLGKTHATMFPLLQVRGPLIQVADHMTKESNLFSTYMLVQQNKI